MCCVRVISLENKNDEIRIDKKKESIWIYNEKNFHSSSSFQFAFVVDGVAIGQITAVYGRLSERSFRIGRVEMFQNRFTTW